jgi:adenylyltransferase/sulfurtransferase
MDPKWGAQSVQAIKAMVDAGVPVVFLDVCTPAEWEDGIIEGAIMVELNELPTPAGIAKLPQDRNAIIAVYCKAGHRGVLALALLHQLGYANARNMNGGITAWKDAGYPVVPPPE